MKLKRRFADIFGIRRANGIKEFTLEKVCPPSPDKMNDLERFFWSNSGPIVHKWLHYFELYDRYFSPYRGEPVKFLEIGVSKGGSLNMWRDYFGPEAIIFGIDIDPACAQLNGKSAQVRIGSQDDPKFLNSVVDEMGGIDIVLDDGSHDSIHIRKSLDILFPRLSQNGCYMIEDLHAAYWTRFSGGYGRPSSFMSVVKGMIDDLHHWYHNRPLAVKATGKDLSGIHIHDSVVVLEKRRNDKPAHHKTGSN